MNTCINELDSRHFLQQIHINSLSRFSSWYSLLTVYIENTYIII